jgi:hypothetical protein
VVCICWLLVVQVRALQAACRALRQDYSPPITYIAVHRDHHTRWGSLTVRLKKQLVLGVPLDA